MGAEYMGPLCPMFVPSYESINTSELKLRERGHFGCSMKRLRETMVEWFRAQGSDKKPTGKFPIVVDQTSRLVVREIEKSERPQEIFR